MFDQLGNPSAVLNRSLLLDTVAPEAPTFDRLSGSFVNASARVDGFTLSGQAEPLSNLQLSWEAFTTVVEVDSNGAWLYHFSPEQIPADSTLSNLTAISLDAVGNVSPVATLGLAIDSLAPVLSITAVGGRDQIVTAAINDHTVFGSAEANLPVALWISGGDRHSPELLLETVADDRGLITVHLTPEQISLIGEGDQHQLELRQTDAAGNRASSELSLIHI